MFKPSRVFSQYSPTTGLTAWFFSAREGLFGPFQDQATAARALESFIQYCMRNQYDGGRQDATNAGQFTQMPMEDFINKVLLIKTEKRQTDRHADGLMKFTFK